MAYIRVLIAIGLLVGLYYLLKKAFPPSDFKKCGKCEGKGYWLALRGRESCDVCKGSGKVPR